MSITRWKTMGIEPGEQQLNSTLSHFGEGLTECVSGRPDKGRKAHVIETTSTTSPARQPFSSGNASTEAI